jgi:hypothetical protein
MRGGCDGISTYYHGAGGLWSRICFIDPLHDADLMDGKEFAPIATQMMAGRPGQETILISLSRIRPFLG